MGRGPGRSVAPKPLESTTYSAPIWSRLATGLVGTADADPVDQPQWNLRPRCPRHVRLTPCDPSVPPLMQPTDIKEAGTLLLVDGQDRARRTRSDRRPHLCAVANSADRASSIVTTETRTVSSSYAYTSSIQGHGPRMKRNPCQRPVRRGPSNGMFANGPTDALTRSRVVAGRLWVAIRRSRSATAAGVRTTAATGS